MRLVKKQNHLKNALASSIDIETINNILKDSNSSADLHARLTNYLSQLPNNTSLNVTQLGDYIMNSYTPMVGASGAIFGIMTAYAFLFPNTELMLLFPPIPITNGRRPALVFTMVSTIALFSSFVIG